MSWLVIQVGSGCGDVVARLDAGAGRSCDKELHLSFWGYCSLTALARVLYSAFPIEMGHMADRGELGSALMQQKWLLALLKKWYLR